MRNGNFIKKQNISFKYIGGKRPINVIGRQAQVRNASNDSYARSVKRQQERSKRWAKKREEQRQQNEEQNETNLIDNLSKRWNDNTDELNDSWDDTKKVLNNKMDDVKREYWDSWNLKDMAPDKWFWEGGKKRTRKRRTRKRRTRKKRTRKKRTRKIQNSKRRETYRKKIKSKKLNGGNKLSRTLCSSWGSLWGTKECGEKIREYKQMLTNMNKMDNLTKLLALSEFIGEGNAIQAMGGINSVNKILNVNDNTKKQLIKIIKEKKLNHI